MILTIGDAIIDIFHIGKTDKKGRFKITKSEYRQGGAANVANNLKVLAQDTQLHFGSGHTQYTRHIEDGKVIFETLHTTGNTDHVTTPIDSDVCVCSDYNKGFFKNRSFEGKARILIADSRYRTLPKSLLDLAEYKILHCTGREFKSGWIRNMGFDFIYHTDGQNPIRYGKLGKWKLYNCPKIETVDTVGAGDTFCAALAAYLLNKPVSEGNLYAAMAFAVSKAQEVCKIRYTATPLNTK